MKRAQPLVVLVLGGVAERWGCPGEHSPLAGADTPNLHRLAREGRVFGVRLLPRPGLAATAAPLLALLGHDPEKVETAAASYIGALQGATLEVEECFASAQFLSLFRDVVADVAPGPLRPAERKVLLLEADRAVRRAGFRMVPGDDPHHLAIAPCASIDDATPPPEFLLGRPLSSFEPAMDQHAFAHRLAREALDGHEINEVRRDLGENGADCLWIWGPGKQADLEQLYSEPVSCFGSDALWRGVCAATGIRLRSPGDRSPAQLVKDLSQALRRDAICLLHARRGVRDALLREIHLRMEGLADLDTQLVGPVAEAVQAFGGRLLILADTARDTATGRPLDDPVPALLWGGGIEALTRRPFTEAGAAAGDPLEPGSSLLAYVRHL